MIRDIKLKDQIFFIIRINFLILNSINFNFYIPMLIFVIEVWDKVNFILLKGIINIKKYMMPPLKRVAQKDDSRFITKDKEKHNALYQLYFYIINIKIAILVRALVF